MFVKPSVFYQNKKRDELQACYPANPFESDASSDSDDNDEASSSLNCSMRKKKKSNFVAEDTDINCEDSCCESEKSTERWPRSNISNENIVIPESDKSCESSPNISYYPELVGKESEPVQPKPNVLSSKVELKFGRKPRVPRGVVISERFSERFRKPPERLLRDEKSTGCTKKSSMKGM